jgi:hypothetical protein
MLKLLVCRGGSSKIWQSAVNAGVQQLRHVCGVVQMTAQDMRAHMAVRFKRHGTASHRGERTGERKQKDGANRGRVSPKGGG